MPSAIHAQREHDQADIQTAGSHTILVPLDGSELAERALPYAVTLARQYGSTVLLLEVADHRHPAADAEVYLRRWAERLAVVCGVAAAHDVAAGQAGPSIVDEAAQRGVDLIVMATHARTGVERMVMGSVADYVLHHAGAPVLLVPEACERVWGGP